MKELIKTIKKLESVVISLEFILQKEYCHLLNSETCNNVNVILELMKKKKILFRNFVTLNEYRILLEKKYSIFAPYQNIDELNNFWDRIVKKCFFLRKSNLKNKILINKKLYLNQYFLELFTTHNKAITYDCKGDLKI